MQIFSKNWVRRLFGSVPHDHGWLGVQSRLRQTLLVEVQAPARVQRSPRWELLSRADGVWSNLEYRQRIYRQAQVLATEKNW